jgi:hypothetical protein
MEVRNYFSHRERWLRRHCGGLPVKLLEIGLNFQNIPFVQIKRFIRIFLETH